MCTILSPQHVKKLNEIINERSTFFYRTALEIQGTSYSISQFGLATFQALKQRYVASGYHKGQHISRATANMGKNCPKDHSFESAFTEHPFHKQTFKNKILHTLKQ